MPALPTRLFDLNGDRYDMSLNIRFNPTSFVPPRLMVPMMDEEKDAIDNSIHETRRHQVREWHRRCGGSTHPDRMENVADAFHKAMKALDARHGQPFVDAFISSLSTALVATTKPSTKPSTELTTSITTIWAASNPVTPRPHSPHSPHRPCLPLSEQAHLPPPPPINGIKCVSQDATRSNRRSTRANTATATKQQVFRGW